MKLAVGRLMVWFNAREVSNRDPLNQIVFNWFYGLVNKFTCFFLNKKLKIKN